MPDPNELARLRRGVAAWNSWRAHNPHVLPDLHGLNPLDLETLARGVDDPFDVCLDGAVFDGADLRGAHFEDASLAGASFRQADLSDASFVRCGLRGAAFDRACLRSTHFRRNDVVDARFQEARFGETLILGIDLSAARGLEAADHGFPSVVDTTTLELTAEGCRRKEVNPAGIVSFLRGCGLSGGSLLAALETLDLH